MKLHAMTAWLACSLLFSMTICRGANLQRVPGADRSAGRGPGAAPTAGWTCPEKCQCSKSGSSVDCEGKRLTAIPDGLPPTVQVLRLDHNNLVNLGAGSLSNLTHLSQVYLRNNQIQTLEAGCFRNLPQLTEVYMSNNNIVHLSPEAFENANALSLLNLQANKMTSLPELRSLPGLKSLVLQANAVRNATIPASYANLTSLNAIVLSNNNISQLTNATFAVLANITLRKLDLNRNAIKNVSTGALTPLGCLQSLKLGLNPLDAPQLANVLQGLREDPNLVSLDIRSIALGGSLPSVSVLSQTPLTTLIFKNNRVQHIPESAFSHLPKLVQLDLSACQITSIAENAFTDLPELQILNLSDNTDLTSIPPNLPKSLRRLYLQGNSLSTLTAGMFRNLGQLRELYLSNNNMHEISEDSFMGLVNLRVLHLQNNLLSYIPKKFFAPFAKLVTLNLKNNKLTSLKPNPGAMQSLAALMSLDMSDNQCNYIPFDYFSDLGSLQTLNLDNNDLGGPLAADGSGLLLGSMRKLQTLSLANNNVRYIHDAQFRNLFDLLHLDLRSNQLSTWGPNLFRTPGSLKKSLKCLDLSSNQIALVNKTSVRDLQDLHTLNLSLNPFACTCDLRWFRTWLDNTTINVANKDAYKCNSPAEWNGKPLFEFGPDKINCTNYTWYYVGGAIAVTFIIALAICSILYRQRWFIRLRCYRLQKGFRNGLGHRRPRDGYQHIPGHNGPELPRYDYYVIAADEDTQWVVDNLLPTLDSGPTLQDPAVHYGGRFRLYFEERDAIRGRQRVASFDENLEASRGALVVLTSNLGRDSHWCRFMVDVAYQNHIDGNLQAIHIIQVGPVRPRHIPQRLHNAMEKREYIEWPNRDTMEQDIADLLQARLQRDLGLGQGHDQVLGQGHVPQDQGHVQGHDAVA